MDGCILNRTELCPSVPSTLLSQPLCWWSRPRTAAKCAPSPAQFQLHLSACALANPSNTTVSQSHRLWAHGGTCAPTSSLALCCNGETPTRKARVTTTSSCRPSIGQTQTAASEPTRQGQPARHPDTTSDPIEVWSTSHFMNPSHPPLMCECLTCQRGKSSTYIH